MTLGVSMRRTGRGRSLRILIVTPAPPSSLQGNRITAMRWARLLRSLRHRVAVRTRYVGEAVDLLIALHARRSAASVRRFRCDHPDRPIVVALTGTDLYHDLGQSRRTRRALLAATRIVVLQPAALDALPVALRRRSHIILQSSVAPPRARRTRYGGPSFDICVLGHLRPVKDPFRAALASRLLPADSRVRILHVGAALGQAMARRARDEERRNPRYRWLGERPHAQAVRILSRCRLLVVSSRMEGGANAVSEALTAGVPVVSSRIDGSIGQLGADYPGFYLVGDTRALADRIRAAETDHAFYERLRRACARRAGLFDPARERKSWETLLRELGAPAGIADRTAGKTL